MLYFSALLMLKYSIWWRPSMLGGRLFLPLPRPPLTFLSHFFAECILNLYPLAGKKKLGFEILLYLPEKGCYFLGGSCCARIEVEVLMYKLRCPCRD